MPGVSGLQPLSIWALFVVLTVLARRDRRLLYHLPVIGVGVVVVRR